MSRYLRAAFKAAFLVLAAYSIGYTAYHTIKYFSVHHPTEAEFNAQVMEGRRLYQSSGGVGLMALTPEEASECLDLGGCVIFKVDQVEEAINNAYTEGQKAHI